MSLIYSELKLNWLYIYADRNVTFLVFVYSLDEKTRVILSGDEQMDYINANYIDFTVGSDVYHYIATQVRDL